MRKIIAMVVATAALAQAGSTVAFAADAIRTYQPPPQQSDVRGGVKIGLLTCDVGGGVGYVLGSAKEADCVFTSSIDNEFSDHYSGDIRKLGVDLGFTTRSRLIWAVFAPTAGYHHGSLAGLYVGAAAEATIGAGVGANVLVGGTTGSIHLQPLSVTGQFGLNVAAAGASMTLTPT